MTLTSRLLPRDEWPRLAGTEAEQLWPLLGPYASVVVVEDGDQIVGTWVVFMAAHAECCWIDPAYRKAGSVARRLVRGLRAALSLCGATACLTASMAPETSVLIERLGGQVVPGVPYRLTFTKETACQS